VKNSGNEAAIQFSGVFAWGSTTPFLTHLRSAPRVQGIDQPVSAGHFHLHEPTPDKRKYEDIIYTDGSLVFLNFARLG
jgi:hypothetical protein